jgi:hypothetical protein
MLAVGLVLLTVETVNFGDERTMLLKSFFFLFFLLPQMFTLLSDLLSCVVELLDRVTELNEKSEILNFPKPSLLVDESQSNLPLRIKGCQFISTGLPSIRLSLAYSRMRANSSIVST